MLCRPLQIRGVGPLRLLRRLIGGRRRRSRGRLVIGGAERPSGRRRGSGAAQWVLRAGGR